ncbi:formate dehydrogenase subunit gamma [Chloroflexota bacterium]
MTHHEVEKYSQAARVLHWTHTTVFVLLFLTGLILFIPGLSFLAEGGITRIIHRVTASVFVVIPLLFLIFRWKATWRGIGEAFSWGRRDVGWLKAAPRFYFLNDESTMPPQGSMNSGQKMWALAAILSGIVFAITGGIMWFGALTTTASILQWMVLLHDIAFIIAGTFLLVHIYLAILHPLMTEAWSAMASGKISAEYAKKHHSRWYEGISKVQKD